MKLEFHQDFLERPINLKPRSTIDAKKPVRLTLLSKLSVEKISDIRSMFAIMPNADRIFYESIFENATKLQSIGSNSQEDCIEPETADASKQKLPNMKRTGPTVYTNPACQSVSQILNNKQNIIGSTKALLITTDHAHKNPNKSKGKKYM